MVAPSPQTSNSSSAHRRRRRSRSREMPTIASQEQTRRSTVQQPGVHAFRPKPKPLWLRLLLRTQQATSIVTLLLITSVLISYSWTVLIQQRWGVQYTELESLKKRERQYTSANELLKNQIAEQAENPTTGLLLPDPSNAIFLAPAPQRSPVDPRPEASPVAPAPGQPLGY